MYRDIFPVEKMCKVLTVSKSGYYWWLRKKPSKRFTENKDILRQIKDIYKKSTVILDLYDRKVIGWSLSDNMYTKNTTIKALKMALIKKSQGPDLSF